MTEPAAAPAAEAPVYSDSKYPGSDLTFRDLYAIAYNAAASKNYPGVGTASAAFMRITRGIDMGLKPTEGLSALQIIAQGGKASLEAVTMGSLIQRSTRFDYRFKEHSDKACELLFYARDEAARADDAYQVQGNGNLDGWRILGPSRFTIEDAATAELMERNANWKKYPRNQLFARAMSNGCRWYCSAVFGGPIYAPDEAEEVDGVVTSSGGNGRGKRAHTEEGGGAGGGEKKIATPLPEVIETARHKAGWGKGETTMYLAERRREGLTDDAIAAEIASKGRIVKGGEGAKSGADTASGDPRPASTATAEPAEQPKDKWGF